MGLISLYHGSQKIIQKPEFGKGKAWNDYGKGFYCTENVELAREWACPEQTDGFINSYEIDTENLNILNLSDSQSQFTTLHWLTVLISNRIFDLDTPILRRGVHYLKENFTINLNECDIIIGYRADDSYFSFAKAFLSNQISYKQLQIAMKLGKLGEQVVIKSPEAFDRLKFINYEIVDYKQWYFKRKNREAEARDDFYNLMKQDDISGLFIRDIILNEVKADDSRLQ
ncbi:MAG: DUF3990 domain-containing protein [Treponema sp.]|nr:DUF3990 domain-containing protein [Treponema sp.]